MGRFTSLVSDGSLDRGEGMASRLSEMMGTGWRVNQC